MRDAPADIHCHWERYRTKPVLKAIYSDLFREIQRCMIPGRTIEIGGGAGMFKEFAPDIINTDIMWTPQLDLVADAQRLPFASASVSNLVAFDVLHHIEFPVLFFREAERVLAEKGRIIMVEPGITPVSYLFYRLFHEEPVRLRSDPWREGKPDPERHPFSANQAIPTRMLQRQRDRFHKTFPGLRLDAVRWMSLFAYPLSGGYQAWSLLPSFLVEPLLKLERRLLPVIGSFAAFRLIAVVTRREACAICPESTTVN